MQTLKTKDGFYIQPGMKITDNCRIYEVIDMGFDEITTREIIIDYNDDGSDNFSLGDYFYFNPYEIGYLYRS